jgi:multiple sugar transport system permease protein
MTTRSFARQNVRRARGFSITPYLFVVPYLIVFLLFRFGPSVVGFLISLTDWKILGNPNLVGLDNYQRLAADSQFFTALVNTGYFMLLAAPPLVLLGLVLALLVDQQLHGRMIARTAIFLPYVVMSTVVGVIWLFIFEKESGILNYYLGLFGISPIAWLSNTQTAMPAVAIATLWWTVGFNMIIFLAGLQDVPQELEDAARVDGATEFAVFRHITLPLLAPATFVVVMLTLINTFQVFDQIYVMTGGGPSLSTLTIIQYLYYQAFEFYKLGYGSAVAYIALAVLIVLAILQQRWLAGSQVR